MKKNIILTLVAACALLISCDPPVNPPTPLENSITLNKDSVSLAIDATYTLIATLAISDTTAVFTWESSNLDVASVDNTGKVTAHKEGSSIITVSVPNLAPAQCVVTVYNNRLQLTDSVVELLSYNTYQLTAVVPDDNSKAFFMWRSSDDKIASVDHNGLVTAIAEGTAVITVSAIHYQSAQCTIVVKDVPATFPRKFLIEHFTGDACGYCPYGMYSIAEHIENAQTPYIWVSHHDGFNKDEYTIPESRTICNALSVNGAPSMSLNRAHQEQGIVFHPGYLPEITIADKTKAAMSIKINHTYDTATRQLDITVSGESSFATESKFLLSVLVKENRLVGRQADYYYALDPYAGWKEYMHARVVRDFLTQAMGDTITIVNQTFSKTYSYNITETWIAENCCVVAYLTPLTGKPIINAEQAVLVEGTTGGEEYNPYGITDATGPKKSITFNSVLANKVDGENVMEVLLISNSNVNTAYGAGQPVGLVYINTDANTLEAGTYSIKDDNSMGSIIAGYRIDEKATLGGSLLMYAVSEYLDKGQLALAHTWRIIDGEMVVDESGNIKFNFTTCNGTNVSSSYTATNQANTLPQKLVMNSATSIQNKIPTNKTISHK